MGLDLNGWIEVPSLEEDCPWVGVANLGELLDRDRDLYACAFGVPPSSRLIPIVQPAPLPCEISPEARRTLMESDGTPAYSMTAVLTAEQFNQHLPTEFLDWPIQRIELSWRQANGTLILKGRDHQSALLSAIERDMLTHEGEYSKGAWHYRLINDTQRIAPTRSWFFLATLLERACRHVPSKHVRIVAGFA